MKFRSIPQTVDAFRFLGEGEPLPSWLDHCEIDSANCLIASESGFMIAVPGSWLVLKKGIQIVTLSPSTFESQYEVAV